MAAQDATARKRRIVNLLDLTLELEPALRGAYLESIGRQDADLKQQVLALLRTLGGQQESEDDATKAESRLASSEMPQRVGPYKIVREIGRGGMSRVYLAERADQEFERQVALKVIDQGLEAPIVHQRFLAERQILASFDCPQIAKLFDGGTLPNGRPYLVMELVDGVRADQHCAERQLGLKERLQLFRKICGAVSYAHQKLVVHRDLKPSNILVTAEGEPKLLDFGIAKLLDPESFPLQLHEATRSHFRPMTPSHASPEQLLGEPITTATDIYALGVLLFQLLTGSVPHPNQDRLQKVLRERSGDEIPPKPSESLDSDEAEKTWSGQDRRRLARQLRGDLDNIVAKALRSQPAERFSSVAVLEEDLRRYLAGEPVRATRETPLYLVGKFLRRYRLSVAVAATVLVLVTSFALVTQRQAHRIAAERDRANEIRGFLANLISSADNQSRISGSVSLKQLLDENAEQLKNEPFLDSQTQVELLKLIGDSYESLGLVRNSVEMSRLALKVPDLEAKERSYLLQSIGSQLAGSGELEEGISALELALEKVPPTEWQLKLNTLSGLTDAYHTAGDLRTTHELVRRALLEPLQNPAHSRELITVLRHRLIQYFTTSADVLQIQEAYTDFLVSLRLSDIQWFGDWVVLCRTLAYLEHHDDALASHRYLFKLAQLEHKHAIGRSQIFELLTESLFERSRLTEALRATSIATRTVAWYSDLDSQAPRARYHLAQAKIREATVLQAMGRNQEAEVLLQAAIDALEPMSRETPIIFAKSTLARAYLIAGRLEEARPLIAYLLERGWRRPDLMRLAASKGVLPDPMPPPLGPDLDLPPKLRAYVDSLPHDPPPWQTATDLPTIEEILTAEETRLGIVPGSAP